MPEYKQNSDEDRINLSLRGVRGFGEIVLRKISTIDAELVKTTMAEKYLVEEWKSGRVEEWKSGRVEEWKSGRVEEWKSGKVEKWKSGKVEKWKSGKVEKWKSGKVEEILRR
ncbi:hypothetical protein ACT0JI_002960 [Cronobacter turicensis]